MRPTPIAPRRCRVAVGILIVMLGAAGWGAAQSDALLARLVPRGHVSDFADVMGAEAAPVEALLTELREKTGAEVAVVALSSLEGGDMADFANRLFERWRIGQAGRDNGALLIAAIEDRAVRIEVGYGLEALIPDARAGRILDDVVLPRFRQQRYGAGLAAGASELATIIALDAGVELSGIPPPAPAGGRTNSREGWVGLLVLLLLALLVFKNPWLAFFLLSGGRGHSGGFGGGFGRGRGGGFGGFGGGMSGGGGAGRSW